MCVSSIFHAAKEQCQHFHSYPLFFYMHRFIRRCTTLRCWRKKRKTKGDVTLSHSAALLLSDMQQKWTSQLSVYFLADHPAPDIWWLANIHVLQSQTFPSLQVQALNPRILSYPLFSSVQPSYEVLPSPIINETVFCTYFLALKKHWISILYF